MTEYLNDLHGIRATFKVIKTYHSIQRSQERDLPLVQDEDVYQKIKEAVPQIEKDWLEREGSFSGWIRSESLKLNIIIEVRLDFKTNLPAIVIITAKVKSQWYPDPTKGDIKYKVSKRASPFNIVGNLYLSGDALLACDSTEGLEDQILADLQTRNLVKLEKGWGTQYKSANGLVYCVNHEEDGNFYVVDANYMWTFPDRIYNVD